MPCFFNFPVSRVRFESRASQVGVHQQKKDCASAKAGKVSLLRREGQSQGFALTYGARSPKATKTWPRATENIVQVGPAGRYICWCWFLDSVKSKN